MGRRISLLVLTVLLTVLNGYSQGLMFRASEHSYDPATSYTVFARRQPVFSGRFRVEFDLQVYDVSTIGNIMRVSGTSSEEVYMLAFSYGDESTSYLKFNIEGHRNLITYPLDNRDLGRGHWIPVRIGFDLSADRVEIDIAGESFTPSHIELPDTYSPSIRFGAGDQESAVGFAIRDLRVVGGREEFFFPLDESRGQHVHDINGRVVGRVENPLWVINDSYGWKKIYSYVSPTVAGVNYDPSTDEVIIFNSDTIRWFDTVSGTERSSGYLAGKPSEMRLGTNYYDASSGKIYAYEVNNLAPGALMASALDLRTLSWTPVTYKYLMTQRHHHAGFADPENCRYTIFGGFGTRQYSNEFAVYDLKADRWSVADYSGDWIAPRFSPSLGVKPDGNILLFGGSGNSSGDQTVGVLYYYDLYELDPRSGTIKKLWEADMGSANLVPVRNMIVSDDGKSFVVLCYPILEPETSLQLYRFSVEDGSREMAGDRIPVTSTSILSNANLYYSPGRGEYYCTVQEFTDAERSEISVYSILTPVSTAAALQAYSSGRTVYILIAVLFGSVLLAGVLLIVSNGRRNKSVKASGGDKVHAVTAYPVMKNSVYFFGDFRAYDRSGKDITYLFGNKIRQLFALLILEGAYGSPGIDSSRIHEALWPDKTSQQAKNLRGVTMNNLRKVLEEFDGLEVIHGDGKFRLITGGTFYSDYGQYLESIKRLLDTESGRDQGDIHDEFAALLTRGSFLKSFGTETFDRYKRTFEEEAVRLLPVEISALYRAGRYEMVLRLVAALLTVEPHSEAALWYEVKSLRKLRNNEEAKKRYYFFKINYLKNMGEDYGRTYEEIVSGDPDSILL